MKARMIEGGALTDKELVEAGKILFLTDADIYPNAFGSSENMGEVFPILARIENGLFEAENLLVAKDDKGNICGVLVGCNSNFWEKGTLARVFSQKGIALPEGAVDAENNYFVYESEHEKGDYVLCLCVAPEYRRLHIGKELLLHYLKGKKEVSLECLADNSGALAMYGEAGFCVEKEYDGYSAPGTSPERVVRMIYRANSHSRYNY